MTAAVTKSRKAPKRKGKGGRPSLADAATIEAHILDVARDLFFRDGYGATSIETLAREARISKRTFYSRFKDKAEIFHAVVHRLIEQMRPADTKGLFEKGSFEEILQKLAGVLLRGSLSAPMLALHRLLLSEATRFPELVALMEREGTRQEAITRIAALLKREAKSKNTVLENPEFLAEQFMMLVIAAPQRLALGLGKPLSERELKDWARRSVALFLKGLWPSKVI